MNLSEKSDECRAKSEVCRTKKKKVKRLVHMNDLGRSLNENLRENNKQFEEEVDRCRRKVFLTNLVYKGWREYLKN